MSSTSNPLDTPSDEADFFGTRVPPGIFEDGHFQKKYAIERELGVGGAGVVVCARHRELDERVAIKFLLSGHENPEAVARFRREARAANRVKSEHVIRIIDVTTTEAGVPYVVMEYLEGSDLERMLLESTDRQLPVRDAIEFVLQACEALAECHAVGIVHRDLKPSNLFCIYGPDGLPSIKVLDFGISKLTSLNIDGAMTGRHAIMGSPRYMPPEQFDTPAEVDRRSDIWALGVIMYELVTGEVPFTGKTLIAIWESVKRDVPRPIGELRRDAPRALAPIVERCLQKDPAARYPNVAELAKDLLPLAPERSRSTVARIVRIVDAPGVTTESLGLPSSHPPAATEASAGAASEARVRRGGRARFAIPLAAVAIGAGVAGYRAFVPSSDHGVVKPSDSVTTRLPVGPVATTNQPVNTELHASPTSVPAPLTAPTAPAPSSSAPSASDSASQQVRSPVVAPRFVKAPTSKPSPIVLSSPSASSVALRSSAPSASATTPPPAVLAPSTTPTTTTPSGTGSASPWIVDIVERRTRSPERP